MNRIVCKLWCILVVVAIGMMPMGAAAQTNYPNKPIRIILGVSPGGTFDAGARVTAQYLQQRLGQPVVVENRPGANTTIGANAVLQAAPDGYTFFCGGVMSASPALVKNSAVDFITQLKPVSLLSSTPWYLIVNSKVPVRTIAELAAYSKQHPDELNYAETAPLATLMMTAIAERTGIKFTTIPYKGSGPALAAVVAGEAQMVLDTVQNYLQHIEAGTVRALMTTGSARMPELPGVPAAPEIKGIDFTGASRLSVWAPPGTPDAIINKISQEIASLAKNSEFRKKFRSVVQVDPLGTTPAELLKISETDKVFYGKIIKQIGFQPQ